MNRRIFKILLLVLAISIYLRTYILIDFDPEQPSLWMDSLMILLISIALILKLKNDSIIVWLGFFFIIMSPIDLYEHITNNKLFFIFKHSVFFNYNRLYPLTLIIGLITCLIFLYGLILFCRIRLIDKVSDNQLIDN